MIYGLLFVIVCQTFLVGYLVNEARKERAQLEDRLMAVYQPVALVQHKAVEKVEVGDVTYIDEAKEYELSPRGQL